MALQKTLLKKCHKYWHPLPLKTSFCDKTIGSRELIFWTIPIKKCLNNLDSETVEWEPLSRLAWNDPAGWTKAVEDHTLPSVILSAAVSECICL